MFDVPVRGLLHIFLLFQFNGESEPIAVTGIQGDVVDMILPSVGDRVQHRDSKGEAFEGKITERIFLYDIKQGMAIDGAVAVTLCLDRTIRERHGSDV